MRGYSENVSMSRRSLIRIADTCFCCCNVMKNVKDVFPLFRRKKDVMSHLDEIRTSPECQTYTQRRKYNQVLPVHNKIPV